MKSIPACALLVVSLAGCAGSGWSAPPAQVAAADYRYMAAYPPLALNDNTYYAPAPNDARAQASPPNDYRQAPPAATDARYYATPAAVASPGYDYAPARPTRRGLFERLFGPATSRRDSACYFPATPTPAVTQPQSLPRHVVRNSSPAASSPVKEEAGPMLPAVVQEVSSAAQAHHVVPASFEAAADSPPPGPPHRLVNCKRISLNYEVKDVGPSGVSHVELWYTQDGRKWTKSDATMPAQAPCIVEVKEEGMHGFTLVARNGLGLGKKPPMIGDAPQAWIEVDSTKPNVKIVDLRLNLTPAERQLKIAWQAADKNLTPRPISISLATRPEGPWTPIVANVENTGSYVWLMQPGLPNRFHIRVEAVDAVGNVGFAQTSEPFLIDMTQPTVRILAIEAAAK